MKRRILLVNPWIHDFAAYDFWAKPMGLFVLAGLLRKSGWAVSVIDCLDRFHPKQPQNAPKKRYGRGPFHKTPIRKPGALADVKRHFSRYGIQPDWFAADLAEISRPDLILVTSLMTYWYTGVRETISIIKKAWPAPPLILGGIYASLCTDHARANSGADRITTGPGETAALELAANISGDNSIIDFDPQQITQQVEISSLSRFVVVTLAEDIDTTIIFHSCDDSFPLATNLTVGNSESY